MNPQDPNHTTRYEGDSTGCRTGSEESLSSAITKDGFEDKVGQPPGPRVQGTPRVRYLASALHAKGGLGEVFLAEDTELHRQVALKQIQERHAANEESRRRFLLEAEITGNLEHPGIVPVYGLG